MKNPQIEGDLFSANGAPSALAWGNAPGNPYTNNRALKARHQSVVLKAIASTALSRAFSPRSIFESHPGALPQARIDTALSALKAHQKKAATPHAGGQSRRPASYII